MQYHGHMLAQPAIQSPTAIRSDSPTMSIVRSSWPILLRRPSTSFRDPHSKVADGRTSPAVTVGAVFEADGISPRVLSMSWQPQAPAGRRLPPSTPWVRRSGKRRIRSRDETTPPPPTSTAPGHGPAAAIAAYDHAIALWEALERGHRCPA